MVSPSRPLSLLALGLHTSCLLSLMSRRISPATSDLMKEKHLAVSLPIRIFRYLLDAYKYWLRRQYMRSTSTGAISAESRIAGRLRTTDRRRHKVSCSEAMRWRHIFSTGFPNSLFNFLETNNYVDTYLTSGRLRKLHINHTSSSQPDKNV